MSINIEKGGASCFFIHSLSKPSEKCFVIPDSIRDQPCLHRENGLARPLFPSYLCSQSRGPALHFYLLCAAPRCFDATQRNAVQVAGITVVSFEIEFLEVPKRQAHHKNRQICLILLTESKINYYGDHSYKMIAITCFFFADVRQAIQHAKPETSTSGRHGKNLRIPLVPVKSLHYIRPGRDSQCRKFDPVVGSIAERI
jgi:hypothetical protein